MNLQAVGKPKKFTMKKQDTTHHVTEKKPEDLTHDQCDCGNSCDCEGEVTQLKAQLETATADANQWKEKCMRALADYQNIERRSREEKNEVRLYASEIILGRLLPVVDTFTRVKAHVQDIGFDLAYKEMQSVLEESGVVRMDVLGKEFNPHEMECVEVVDGDENIVMEETLAGYRFYEKVLRVSQVKVGKKTA